MHGGGAGEFANAASAELLDSRAFRALRIRTRETRVVTGRSVARGVSEQDCGWLAALRAHQRLRVHH